MENQRNSMDYEKRDPEPRRRPPEGAQRPESGQRRSAQESEYRRRSAEGERRNPYGEQAGAYGERRSAYGEQRNTRRTQRGGAFSQPRNRETQRRDAQDYRRTATAERSSTYSQPRSGETQRRDPQAARRTAEGQRRETQSSGRQAEGERRPIDGVQRRSSTQRRPGEMPQRDGAGNRRPPNGRNPGKRKPRRRHYYIPGWLFVAVMILFDEWILHMWTKEDFVAGRFAAVLIFAVACGSLLAFLTSLLSGKAQKRCAVGITGVMAVLYLLEYFLTDAYHNFMPFVTIFAGAEGVAKDYFGLVMTMLLKNLWRIALLLLPVVLYGMYARCEQTPKKLRYGLAGCAAAMYLLGFCVVQLVGIDKTNLTSAYNFDAAVRSFGLNMGFLLDAVHGDSADPGFDQIQNFPGSTDPASTGASGEGTAPSDAPTIPQGDNVLKLDFNALAAAESKSAVANIHSYVAGLTPSPKNAYTGLFKGKNMILITAEAFAGEVIDKDLTPTLYRLANQGIKFTDYYQPAWGASTIGGEYSNVVGLMPATGAKCMHEAAEQSLFMTIGSQLRKQGYYSAAYHNNDYTYYDRNESHIFIGYDRYIGMGNGMEEGVTKQWPASDLEMMQFTVPQYIDHQPFSIYYMTVSGHALYNKGGNAMTRKNFDKVEQLDCSETVKCYLACQLELENALAYLVGQLEAAGIADDTVIALTADHYPYALEKSSTWHTDKDYLSELFGQTCNNCFIQDHNALILWSGCLEGKNIVVDTPVSSLDILPTLSNLFGVEYDSRLLPGRDVLSNAQPLVFWPNSSWKTEKGTYNASNGSFTPAEGVQVEDGYVDYIKGLVKNKISYCKSVAKNDYYNYVLDAIRNGGVG